MRRVLRHVFEHGVFSLICFFLDALRNQIVTRFLLRKFELAGIYIGKNAILRGARNIRVGRSFFAKDMLWLDAITRYGAFNYTPAILIGERVSISRNVHIAAIGTIEIGDDAIIGSNVLIADHSHGQESRFFAAGDDAPVAYAKRALYTKGPIKIGKNVWIGDGVVVLPGVSIGDNAVIGANSVVVRDIQANVVAVGAPARAISGNGH